MRSSLILLSLVPAVLLTASCAPDIQSEAHWDGSVRDSAGIQIVENYGEPLWKPGEEWKLVPELRIGTLDGPPEYQFGKITGFTPLSDGRLVVADGMASKVRFYTAKGEHLYSVGKQGEGPREFGQGWLRLLRGYGDTLLVVDSRNYQVHRLAPDGAWLASFSIQPEDGWWVGDWDSAPSGLIVNSASPVQRPDTPPSDTMDVVIVRNLDGTLGDTVGRVPTTQNFRFAGDTPEWHYYAGIAHFCLRWDGGLVTGRSDRYELIWRHPGGEPERIVRLHREPNPFTAAEQATFMDRADEVFKRDNRPPERIRQIKDAYHFEEHYPYYRRLVCGPQGSVWLQRVRPIRDMTEEEVHELTPGFKRPRGELAYDVFDGEGRYLGIVDIPPEAMNGAGNMFGDRFVAIATDELDVQYLMIWRIEGLEEDVVTVD